MATGRKVVGTAGRPRRPPKAQSNPVEHSNHFSRKVLTQSKEIKTTHNTCCHVPQKHHKYSRATNTKAMTTEALQTAWLDHFVVIPVADCTEISALARSLPADKFEGLAGDDLLQAVGEVVQGLGTFKTISGALEGFLARHRHRSKPKTDALRAKKAAEAAARSEEKPRETAKAGGTAKAKATHPHAPTPTSPAPTTATGAPARRQQQQQKSNQRQQQPKQQQQQQHGDEGEAEDPEVREALRQWREVFAPLRLHPKITSREERDRYLVTVRCPGADDLTTTLEEGPHGESYVKLHGIVAPKSRNDQMRMLQLTRDYFRTIPRWQQGRTTQEDVMRELGSGRYGRVDEILQVPADGDASEATSETKNGILVLSIPKQAVHRIPSRPAAPPSARQYPGSGGQDPFLQSGFDGYGYPHRQPRSGYGFGGPSAGGRGGFFDPFVAAGSPGGMWY